MAHQGAGLEQASEWRQEQEAMMGRIGLMMRRMGLIMGRMGFLMAIVSETEEDAIVRVLLRDISNSLSGWAMVTVFQGVQESVLKVILVIVSGNISIPSVYKDLELLKWNIRQGRLTSPRYRG